MFTNYLHQIPAAFFESLIICTLFLGFYQLGVIYFHWNARIKYIIANLFILLGTVHYLSIIFFSFSITSIQFNFLTIDTTIFVSKFNDQFLTFISIGYLVFVAYLLSNMLYQLVRLHYLSKQSDFSNSNKFIASLKESCESILPTIKIGTNSNIKVPITFGIFESIILIPTSICNNISPTYVKYILLHELSHIYRYDFIINLGIEIVNIILCFNPVIYLFKNEIQLQREIICDQYVVSKVNNPIAYSKTLLQIANLYIGGSYKLSMPIYDKKNDLITRIQSINNLPKNYNYKNLLILIILLPFFFSFIFLESTTIRKKNIEENKIYSNKSVQTNNIQVVSAPIITKYIPNKKHDKLPLKKSKYTKQKNNLNKDLHDEFNTKNIDNLTFNELVQLTKSWMKFQENNINKLGYTVSTNELYENHSISEYEVKNFLVLKILQNYELKKSILNQKLKYTNNFNEAIDYFLNSAEWNDILLYEKWMSEFLASQ